MNQGRGLNEVITELQLQSEAKADYIAPGRGMRMLDDGNTFEINHLKSGEKMSFSSTRVLHRQIGETLNIPAKYYDLMRKEKPDLLANNINSWFMDMGVDNNYMVRTFRYPEVSIGRALLSPKYRRIDNLMIAETVLPMFAGTTKYEVISCEVTERSLYFKIVNHELEAMVSGSDVVQGGVVVSNSEVGMGAVSVQPFVYRLVCSNGMIVEELGSRKTHVGRVQESVDDSFNIYTSETQEAEDRALALKIRDYVKASLDETVFNKVVGRLKVTKKDYIEGNPGDVVKLTGKVYELSNMEQTGILRHLVEGGDLSKYGLTNAITRTSQDVKDYDRATELEGLGWKVATMDNDLWNRINGDVYSF